MKISKEQKEAIEYYQNKEVSLSVDFDNENLLKALGITEEDSFENHQIRFKTLLNLIEKLQKENEELKEENEYNKLLLELNNNFTIDKKTGNYKWNVIEIQKIKDKIEELNNNRQYLSQFKDYKEKDYTNEEVVNNCVEVLQELLESE